MSHRASSFKKGIGNMDDVSEKHEGKAFSRTRQARKDKLNGRRICASVDMMQPTQAFSLERFIQHGHTEDLAALDAFFRQSSIESILLNVHRLLGSSEASVPTEAMKQLLTKLMELMKGSLQNEKYVQFILQTLVNIACVHHDMEAAFSLPFVQCKVIDTLMHDVMGVHCQIGSTNALCWRVIAESMLARPAHYVGYREPIFGGSYFKEAAAAAIEGAPGYKDSIPLLICAAFIDRSIPRPSSEACVHIFWPIAVKCYQRQYADMDSDAFYYATSAMYMIAMSVDDPALDQLFRVDETLTKSLLALLGGNGVSDHLRRSALSCLVSSQRAPTVYVVHPNAVETAVAFGAMRHNDPILQEKGLTFLRNELYRSPLALDQMFSQHVPLTLANIMSTSSMSNRKCDDVIVAIVQLLDAIVTKASPAQRNVIFEDLPFDNTLANLLLDVHKYAPGLVTAVLTYWKNTMRYRKLIDKLVDMDGMADLMETLAFEPMHRTLAEFFADKLSAMDQE